MADPTNHQLYALLGRLDHGFETRTAALPAMEAVLREKGNWDYEVVSKTIAGLKGPGPEMRAKRARASARFRAAVAALKAKPTAGRVAEAPAEAGEGSVEMAALQSENARLKAENARLRAEGGKPEEIPDGMIFVAGHLRRKR